MNNSAEYHLQKIKSDGFSIIKNAIPQSWIYDHKLIINNLILTEDLIDEKSIPKLNKGHDIIYSLEWKNSSFLNFIINHKIIIEILKKCLNDSWYKQIPPEYPNFILRAMIARSGGASMLPLHIDSFIPSSGSFPHMMQVALILEDQYIENGCMFCIPGSHKSDLYADNNNINNNIIPIVTKACDVVIWDSRLHHGAFSNESKNTRWSVIATFSRWWIKQNYQTHLNLTEEFKMNLSVDEKIVLGLCSIPPINISERVDIKAGIDILKNINGII